MTDFRLFSNPHRGRPDLEGTLSMVSAKIGHAILRGSAALDRIHESFALIGGAAVGAYGAPRMTKDVDFLVLGQKTYVESPLTFAPDVPIAIGQVNVDYLVAQGDHIRRALGDAVRSRGVPILPVEPLVCLKLRANRRQDRIDVGALVAAGATTEAALGKYLGENEPDLMARLDRALIEWEEEHG